VIESARHEVAVIHQARLHGVGQRHTEHQITPAAARVFRGSQRHAEIVCRVACFGGRQEIIHEVDVSHERRVPVTRHRLDLPSRLRSAHTDQPRQSR